jgi:hypothetical protein
MDDMIERRPDAYVTNADLDAALSLLATKTELQEMGKRLALEIVKTQSDIRDVKQAMSGLSTKADTDRIMTAIDSFANKAMGYDNARTLHGHRLTEHAERLDDHEGRIKKLEGEA